MTDIQWLLIVLIAIPIVILLWLFVSWLISGLGNAGNVSLSFTDWSKLTLHESYLSTRFRAFIINVFFHFIVLGMVIRPLFYPEKPNEEWIVLFGMAVFMRNIVAYFYGWEMMLRGYVPADAPKYQRFILFLMFSAGYILFLLLWFDVIIPLNN